MAKKLVKRWRKFLVPDLSINADSYIVVKNHGYDAATVKIADCNRAISLEFDFSSKKGLGASRLKLNTLREGLDIIEKTMAPYEKLEAYKKKAKQ